VVDIWAGHGEVEGFVFALLVGDLFQAEGLQLVVGHFEVRDACLW